MFDKRKNASARLRIIIFTLFLVTFSFTLSNLWKSEAAANVDFKIAKSAKNKLSADVKLNDFSAEKFSNGVKISFQTSFERNIIGFRVRRENGGKKMFVNRELIGGSLIKSANGVLENGSEYILSDNDGNYQSFYRLEAVGANGKSIWFGTFSVCAGNNLTEELPENLIQPRSLNEQIDRLDFTAKQIEENSGGQLAAEISLPESDASAIKFEVKKDGLYRIDAADLTQFGLPRGISEKWKLFADGIEQPMIVNDDGSVEFYGRGIDTFYSDARVYWLTRVAGNGARINRTTQNFNETAQQGWSKTIAEKRNRVLRAPGILNGERENWYAGFIYSVALNQTVNLSEIATESGESAVLTVDLQGVGGVPHNVSATLNGAAIGQTTFNYTERKQWSINLPLSLLVEGANTLSLSSPSSSDLCLLEAVRISYPRRHKAENNRLDFQLNGGRSVKLKGFTTSDIRIFDITNHENITEVSPASRLETDGTYTATLDSAPSERILLAQGGNVEFNRASSFMQNSASDLRSTANRAKFIIIGRGEAFEYLQELKSRREAEGLPTQLIDIADIYDEFNHGIKSAAAIKNFLQYAKESWEVKPEYVLLAGDASVDPRNYSGLGGDAKNVVPTMFVDTWNLEAVTDEMLVDFDDDDIGELAIGRLPYQTLPQLEAMTHKIYSVEPMLLSEINERGVVFVSDAPQGYDFAAASRNIALPIPAAVSPIFIDRGTLDSAIVNSQIMTKINDGAIVVNYFGHGQIYNWTNENVLTTTDAPNMVNTKRPSLMAMIACLNGAFAETNLESLAESVMKTPNGGAFAVWSASASNTADAQEILAKEYNQRIFTGMRLGDAARETKMTTYIPDIRRTYVFFGDPTQRIVAPLDN